MPYRQINFCIPRRLVPPEHMNVCYSDRGGVQWTEVEPGNLRADPVPTSSPIRVKDRKRSLPLFSLRPHYINTSYITADHTQATRGLLEDVSLAAPSHHVLFRCTPIVSLCCHYGHPEIPCWTPQTIIHSPKRKPASVTN